MAPKTSLSASDALATRPAYRSSSSGASDLRHARRPNRPIKLRTQASPGAVVGVQPRRVCRRAGAAIVGSVQREIADGPLAPQGPQADDDAYVSRVHDPLSPMDAY